MIFDWSGLKDQKYFLLVQKPDPLKYCNYALPFPMAMGLPCMPCDLPNQYQLISTNSTYTEQNQVYLRFQENVSIINRILMPASHRPWNIVAKDYYNHTPYIGHKQLNLCFSSTNRPEVIVYFEDKFIGKVIEKTIINCCCTSWGSFQQFVIYNNKDEVAYRVVSKSGQKGQFMILPCWGFDTITYYILEGQRKSNKQGNINKQQIYASSTKIEQQIFLQDDIQNDDGEGQVVGQIIHLFNGISEYTSKNDRYGITFPQKSNQEDKCLLIYCTLLIDYLLFQNF